MNLGHTKDVLLAVVGVTDNKRLFRIYGKWIRRFGTVSVVGLIVIFAMAVAPIAPQTEYAEAAESSTTSLTVATGKSNAEVDLLVNSENGTFAKSTDDQMARFSVNTNNYTGYTLSIAGYDDTGQLVNDRFGEVLGVLDSVSSATPVDTFANSSDSTYNGKWGYRPSKYNNSSNTSFRPAPGTGSNAQMLDRPTSAVNRDYTIAVGARADYSMPLGTYTNTFVLTVVANAATYQITFSDTTGDTTVSGIPATMSGTSDTATTVYLPSTKPTSDYKVFRYWCAGTVSDEGRTCSGTTYNAGAGVPVNQTTANNYALKAVWYPSLQNLEASQCTTTASQAADIRDGQVYTIKRLLDGRCWMIDNLNLGATTLTKDLTPSNSNLGLTVKASTFNGWKTTGSATLSYVDGVFIPVDDTDSTSGTKYGILYNYHAATGGEITGSSQNIDAQHDICPAGWRMPIGNTAANGNELAALYTAYGSASSFRASVANGGAAFTLAGGWTTAAAPSEKGTAGYYWTQSAYTANSNVISRYQSKVTDSAAPVVGAGNRRSGRSIRCVLRPSISDVTYLQDFNGLKALDRGHVVKSMQEQTNYTLVDNRDSQEYTIAKLKDGKVWMTQNLNLGDPTYTLAGNLTSANTNLSTQITKANFTGTTYNRTGQSVATTYTAPQYVIVSGTDPTNGTKYGGLYNYDIATATTIKVASSTVDPTYDICPAGWRLPTGGTTGELATMANKYGQYAMRNVSTSFFGGPALSRAGYFSTTTTIDSNTTGQYGYYWTSTTNDATTRYGLRVYSTGTTSASATLNTGLTIDRKYGASIRCILKASVGDLTTLQDASNLSDKAKTEIATSMPNKFVYPLVDERDGQTYMITKYATGTVWMVDNLNLGAKLLVVSQLDGTNTNITDGSTIDATKITSTDPDDGWNNLVHYNSSAFPQLAPITTANSSNGLDTDPDLGIKYGTLYNYCAATAGTKCSSSSQQTDASSDLCPAGWRLPTGGSSAGDFKTLIANTNYNSTTKMMNSIMLGGGSFVRAGKFGYNNYPQYQGSNGNYWSSTVNETSGGGAYSLVVDTYYSTAQHSLYNSSFGFSIRCILK